jgi:hypothetical protein
MFIRTSTLSLAIAAMAMTATTAFALDIGQPETQSSPAAQAVAEARHLAKVHGIDNSAKQPEAQASGDANSQAVAEANHMRKSHGNVNNAADKRLEFDHPNH